MSDPQLEYAPPSDCLDGSGECTCPVCNTLEVLGKKWTTHALGVIYEREVIRFNELQRVLGDISSRVLSDRLKELEALGLVERVDYQEVPPRVEYHTTAKGERIVEAALPLVRLLLAPDDEPETSA